MTDQEKKVWLLQRYLEAQMMDIKRSGIPYGKTLDYAPEEGQILHFGKNRFEVVIVENQPKPEEFVWTNDDIYIIFTGKRFQTTKLEGWSPKKHFHYMLKPITNEHRQKNI